MGPNQFQYLGEYIRNFRKKHALSMDQLATKSEVSSSMICQIETGKTTPTLTVLWKLAMAMDVPISNLVDPATPKKSFTIHRKAEQEQIFSPDGSCVLRRLSLDEARTHLELYAFEFAKPGRYRISVRPPSSKQYLSLETGELEIESPDASATIKPGDGVELEPSFPHTLRQGTTSLSKGTLVVSYH